MLYVSTHQFPFYPGTGDFGEAGRGAGVGATLNVPLPPAAGDARATSACCAACSFPCTRRFARN